MWHAYNILQMASDHLFYHQFILVHLISESDSTYVITHSHPPIFYEKCLVRAPLQTQMDFYYELLVRLKSATTSDVLSSTVISLIRLIDQSCLYFSYTRRHQLNNLIYVFILDVSFLKCFVRWLNTSRLLLKSHNAH